MTNPNMFSDYYFFYRISQCLVAVYLVLMLRRSVRYVVAVRL